MLARSEKIEWKTYDKCKSDEKKERWYRLRQSCCLQQSGKFFTRNDWLFAIQNNNFQFARVSHRVFRWRDFGKTFRPRTQMTGFSPPPKRMQTTHSWRMELTVVQTFNLWQWWCAISGNYSKSLQRRESPMQTKTDNEDAKEKWTRHFLDTMTASLKAQAC